MKKSLIIVFLLIGILLRLQNFRLLPIDAHAMRQTDTESVSFNFAFRNGNILYPQNSLMRPQSNTQSYFFLEFPLYQYGLGLLYRSLGWHIELAHLYNLLLFLGSFGLLYYFVKNFFNEETALWSLFFFTFAPGSIFFIGHAIHPDVFAIFTALLSLAAYIYWKNNSQLFFFAISIISLSVAISTRPFMLLVLPAYFFMMWRLKARAWEYPLTLAGSVGIYGLWKLWQSGFAGSDYSWENWVLAGRENLFVPQTFFKQLIYKNIVGEILGKSAAFFALIGALSIFFRKNIKALFVVFWLAAVPIYWYYVPYGNLYHQYYANVYLIPMVIIAGLGMIYFLDFIKNLRLKFVLLSLITALTVYNGFRTSSNFFKDIVPAHYLDIAHEIEKTVPFDDRLVYLGRLNSVPFSLVHRRGWILGAPPVDVEETVDSVIAMKKYQAKYVVAGVGNTDFNAEKLKELESKTKLILNNSKVKIYRLD